MAKIKTKNGELQVKGVRAMYDRQNDAIRGCLLLADGSLVCVATTPLGPIRERLADQVMRLVKPGLHIDTRPGVHTSGEDDAALIGLSIPGAKAFGKAVRKLATKRTLTQIARIVKDPRVTTSLEIASTIYPPLGISYGAVKKAAALTERIHKGDLKAQKQLMAIAVLAAKGDPAAEKARKAMLFLHRLKVAQKVNVAGWAEELGAWAGVR
jgi:hypothetical protein